MWQFLLPMAANALLSVNQARKNQEAQKQSNLAQAEMTRYSPWTHQAGQIDMTAQPSSASAAFGGAVQGLGIGQSINNAFASPAQANPAAGLDASQKQVYNGITQQKPMSQWEMLAGQPNFYNNGGMFS